MPTFPRAAVSLVTTTREGKRELTSEDELIRRAQAGDLEAFCALSANYHRRIYALALHYCRDAHDAEDLSQEVWLRAFRSLGGFQFRSSFYTWLRQITVNTFLNDRRAQTTTRNGARTALRFDSLDETFAENDAPPLPARSGAEDELNARVLVSSVARALGGLTPQQRLMFLLKHQEGLTYQEIADCFGCTAGSVKKSLFRTLARLRAALGVRREEEADVAALTAAD
jgi:RNA polymerase sigma-70 factor, ECF subfamily